MKTIVRLLRCLLLVMSFGVLLVACPPGGGGDDWIVGFWGPLIYAPNSNLFEFRADGTYYDYRNYAGTSIRGSGTWSLKGNEMTWDGTQTGTISKVNDNQFFVGDPAKTLYRKGVPPVASIFSVSVAAFSLGVWTNDSVADEEMKSYIFTASSAGSVDVLWEDGTHGGGGLTGDVRVSAYKSDEVTVLFYDDSGTNPPPQTITLGAGQKIYVLVEGAYAGGTFRVMVQ